MKKEKLLKEKESERAEDFESFTSRVIHDLRNPLSSIKLAAYNIKRKAGNPNIEKHLDVIDNKVTEINEILKSLRGK